ncbi:hypothetical protein MRX96_027805 [Rhipicephalus microplus]
MGGVHSAISFLSACNEKPVVHGARLGGSAEHDEGSKNAAHYSLTAACLLIGVMDRHRREKNRLQAETFLAYYVGPRTVAYSERTSYWASCCRQCLSTPHCGAKAFV